ncbi:MAG TPA: MlaD family protein [Casimicrobiaceae bacterium]|nr:MlaD family protein [Casimicrobiaceae bacterium]
MLAAIVALGIAIQRVRSEGPTITIAFRAADGVEAGKTFIKYKDVRIGQVTAVELSEDYSKVLVRAKIARHAAGLMVQDAKFWIVAPQISLGGVSGLNTLLSGNYIGFQAGNSSEEQTDFIGLDAAPIINDQTGRAFTLKARTLGALDIGSPVYYHQIKVGQVAAYKLAADGSSVEITVFVESPYDKYVKSGTRFWNAGGIDVSVGADGVDVRTESLVAALVGGVAFDTPHAIPAGEQAAPDAAFTLYRNRKIAMRQPDPVARRFVLNFKESVRGLSVGAPVTLYGMRVGEVTEVSLAFDSKTRTYHPRVLITFFPDLVTGRTTSGKQAAGGTVAAEMSEPERLRVVRRMVEERGLRGQLQTGSLLTGELYVAFEYFPDLPKPKIDWTRDPLELPVVPSTMVSLEAKLTSILTKIDSMPLDAIGIDLKNALATLDRTMKDADTMMNSVNVQLIPQGTKALEELRRAIANADRVVTNADAAYFGTNSPVPQDAREAIQEVTRAARSVRVLVDYLERHPEMLNRGKPGEKP